MEKWAVGSGNYESKNRDYGSDIMGYTKATEVECTCDRCGGSIENYGELICKDCHDARVNELNKEIEDLETIKEELEAEVNDLELKIEKLEEDN